MMYFTGSADAVEDPAAMNDEFEAQQETEEYELKVARLLKNAHRRIKSDNPDAACNWAEAIQEPRKGDHYLLVL